MTLTAFADDKKVKLIKQVKATLSPHDPKFNLAGVSESCTQTAGRISYPLSPPPCFATDAAAQWRSPVQAKKFVESLPNTVREDISKEDAEALKVALEAAGGTVTIE